MFWLRSPIQTKSFIPKWILISNRSKRTHLQLYRPNQHHHHLLSLLLKNPRRHESLQIHSQLITTGLYRYGIEETGTVIWKTLLREYSQGNFPEEALKLYKQVEEICALLSVSVPTDSFTYSFLLKACANLNEPRKGIQVHSHIIKVGFEFHVYVETALVNMYMICGNIYEAKKVFDEMPERNSVSWNAMITGLTKWGELNLAQSLFEEMPSRTIVSWTGLIDGYTRMNKPMEALSFFKKMMITDCIKPTEITILAILPAISKLGALVLCQLIHIYSEKNGLNSFDIRVNNSLIDAYGKCGCIKSANKFFEEISFGKRNLVSWTSIISGFVTHGMAKEAFEKFKAMEKVGFSPNRVTFLSILNACSRGGLVNEGLDYFSKMVNGYGIEPNIKHYGCLIDMLGRVGRLNEAERLVREMMPTQTLNVVVWRTLLGACSVHGDVEMGERVMRNIMEMESGYSGDYVLLSNIFAGVGRFGDAEKVRRLMDERNVSKVPGLTLI